jgi:alpha-D-xyloside xylohydrolase
MYGPSLKEILPRYTTITGQPALPPKWSFGLWMGRITYSRQDQVEGVAQELRKHQIPCDVIHIDTGWYENEWDCNYCFGPEKFPDPVGMIESLRLDGFRVSLWQWPNLSVGSAIFAEGREKGYFARRTNGSTYTYPGFLEDTALIDYSNPEAVAWVQEKIYDLLDMGIAAIKVDFGEGAPVEAKYHDVPSESMHNLYPLLYGKAIYEVTQEVHGEDQSVLWARAAWAGSQRYPVHWSGDGIARFEDLACVLRAALSFGMSGFPFYSHDIGGFSGIPSPSLYVRWAQFGLFSSHSRCHGEPPREPWAYGEKAEAIFRRYAELRYRLMPYIYSQAIRCTQTSLPMVRPLVLEFQDDPTAAQVFDQYLFGEHILVAPILDETNCRCIYLPPGTWVDYWTKTHLQGPTWLQVEAPLDLLPLYIRGGSILPHGPLCQYVDEKPLDPLTLEIYAPQTSGNLSIYEPDRVAIEVNYRSNGEELLLETSPAPGKIEVVFHGLERCEAWLVGKTLPMTRLEDGGWQFSYDGRQPVQLRLLATPSS